MFRDILYLSTARNVRLGLLFAISYFGTGINSDIFCGQRLRESLIPLFRGGALNAADMVTALAAAVRWGAIISARRSVTLARIARNLSTASSIDAQGPENSTCDSTSSAADTAPPLFHREIQAIIREVHKRETNALRREGKW